MIKANETKRGDAICYNGKLLLIKDIDIQIPSARGMSTLYKIRFSDIQTGLKIEKRFKCDDVFEEVQLFRRPASFSYVSGNEYYFIDDENFTSYMFKKDQIKEELLFIPAEGLPGIMVMLADEQIIGLELPQTVVLQIIETAPAMKGATATSCTKQATLTTGLTVQVPEYINSGEKIKIHIGERRYMSRVKG